MEVSLRYTLLLIVFFSKMLDGRVSGVDGVDTPFTVMITRAPAVLVKKIDRVKTSIFD